MGARKENKAFIDALNKLTTKMNTAKTLAEVETVNAEYVELMTKPQPNDLAPLQASSRITAITAYAKAYNEMSEHFGGNQCFTQAAAQSSVEPLAIMLGEQDDAVSSFDSSSVEHEALLMPVTDNSAPGKEDDNINPVSFSKKELYIKDIDILIQKLLSKADDLKDHAAVAAREVASNLHKSLELYCSGALDLDGFKQQTSTLLKADTDDEHVQELRKHRGWKGLIVSLLSAILSTGTAQSLFNNYSWFQTDSAVKLNAIKNTVENTAEENPAPTI